MKQLIAATLFIMCCPIAADVCGDEQAEILFVRRIAPLLREKCLACHGAEGAQLEGGLDLRHRDGLIQGGDSQQPSVVPGKPEASPLLLAVTRRHEDWSAMPPKEADQLSEEQTAWIRNWIANGAVWPDAASIERINRQYSASWSAEDGIPVHTTGGLSPEWTQRRYKPEDLWAWQPVRKPHVDSAVQAIDQLLANQLPAKLEPAPAADRRILIRRASFDLLGLPPAPEEITAFISDPTTDEEAFARVVDRLLQSPHYGERMAQHWLDVVRYADSSGFANDFERGNAWRYRDYVVRAFNSDKPYDEFIREQIAGDELHPDNPELLVATGFLRMGPWELTGMEVARVARQRFLDDVTNSVGETFLAQSLQCARCHDHKFDPVSTGDYYSLQAVFATTQLTEREAPFLSTEVTSGFDERKYLEQRRAEYLEMLQQLDRKLLQAADAWFTETGVDPAIWNEAVQDLRQQKGNGQRRESGSIFNNARSRLMAKGVAEDQFPPKLLGFAPADYGNERIARKGLERLRWELDRYEPFALAVYSGRTPNVKSVVSPVRMPMDRMTSGELEESRVLIGGDPFAAGPKVSPGVLSVLADRQTISIPEDIEGRRRAFAEWVASPDNPLTTRAIVNRIWMWHFNQPLAGNPNNFGSSGQRPTHPELLDWLAASFVEQGWSFRALHRIIMNSAAYRRSSQHPDHVRFTRLDPEGNSYAVFRARRLSAEELRDAMLTATGELNRQIGGIPNRPEINPEAALQPRQVMGTFASAWVPNPLPSQRHRRSLYALKIRGLRDPFREIFNEPSPDFSCEQREASTVTPQVFAMFNSQHSHSRALALADRAIRETSSDSEALKRCFQLAYGRDPAVDEQEFCMAHWRDAETIQQDVQYSSERPPLMIQREAVEENTGERFVFREQLYSNQHFVPDLQRSELSPHARALGDICLALLNSNEFVYVY